MVKASKLRNLITFLDYEQKNAQSEKNWVERMSLFSEIRIISDKVSLLEGVCFGDVVVAEYYMFIIRFHSEVNAKMRISFNDELYEIRKIVNEGMKNRELRIITLKIGKF